MRIIGRLAAWTAVLGMPAVAWALAHTAWALWDGRGPAAPVEDLVAVGAAGIGATVAGHLALTGGAMVLGALVRGGRTIPRAVAALAPASWRRVTATALGITMSAGLAAPALASQPSSPHADWGGQMAGQTVSPALAPPVGSPAGWANPVTAPAPPADGGAVAVGFAPAPESTRPAPPPQAPDRTAQSAVDDAPGGGASEAAPAGSRTYTVERGDSLWRITATLLGPGASDASVNRAWPELYVANADAIGADPALIHPGLALTVPTGFPS